MAILAYKLQWGRNLIVAEGVGWVYVSASGEWLQWGRNLIVAEGLGRTALATERAALQWGRNLIVAEGPPTRRPPSLSDRFNGAAT